MGRGRFGGGRGPELLSHLLHRYPYHLCIDCDSPSLPLLGLTAACQVYRQHWRPNHQLQTLSHCMSLDSRAKSQLHCSTVRHQMTPCTNPSPDTQRHILMHTPSSTMIRDRPHRARGWGPSQGIFPNNAFGHDMQYLTSVFNICKPLCLNIYFLIALEERKIFSCKRIYKVDSVLSKCQLLKVI